MTRLDEIKQRVQSLIDGPHEWPLGKNVQCVQYANEHAVNLAKLLHEDVPALLAVVEAVGKKRELVQKMRSAEYDPESWGDWEADADECVRLSCVADDLVAPLTTKINENNESEVA